jgi:hypothetical protein
MEINIVFDSATKGSPSLSSPVSPGCRLKTEKAIGVPSCRHHDIPLIEGFPSSLITAENI